MKENWRFHIIQSNFSYYIWLQNTYRVSESKIPTFWFFVAVYDAFLQGYGDDTWMPIQLIWSISHLILKIRWRSLLYLRSSVLMTRNIFVYNSSRIFAFQLWNQFPYIWHMLAISLPYAFHTLSIIVPYACFISKSILFFLSYDGNYLRKTFN